MREIKFRAWHIKEKRMFEVETLHPEFWRGGGLAVTEHFTDDTVLFAWEGIKVMQFTGLKDKNGKEIYEGDIVRYDLGEREEQMGASRYEVMTIYFEQGAFCVGDQEEIRTFHCLYDMVDPGTDETDYEVIGNIYENPELLTE